jgi:prolyl oligopeptidase
MLRVLEPPPFTPVDPVTEVLHGVEITDPYRWLEDQNSPRTRQWIEEQTAYTRAYFDAIPGRERIRRQVEELLAPKDVIAEPWNVGNRYFFLKRQTNSEQHSIVMREGLHGEEHVLVDPSQHGTGSSTAVSIATISQDGRFLAYAIRQGGTDHAALEILDINNNVVLPDRFAEGFFGIRFAPDSSGFYYCQRPLNDLQPNHNAVFWHRFGTDKFQDQEVFLAGEEPGMALGILHSSERQLLAYVVCTSAKNPKTSIFLHRMEPGASPTLLLDKIEGSFVPFFVRGQLFALTDCGAPNFRIVCIDLVQPDASHWRDIIPESGQPIQAFAVADETIFVTRTEHFCSKLEAYTVEGHLRRRDLFPFGTIELMNHSFTSTKLFYSYSSLTEPPAVHCYDTEEHKATLWSAPSAPVNRSLIGFEEVVYPSKDGTSIPLLLAARKDLIRSGPLPTLLTGYGGFGKCVTPRFTAFASFLIEHGILFALAAVRGGAELGKEWCIAGKRVNRQNAFNDFTAAAEWLVAQGRSAPGRIAVGGGSNAGLLVGAAITQRPELFRACLCIGPLLDMTRYHLFDLANSWADEYGSPGDEREFRALHAYSPYHLVHNGTAYPAVLFVSGDSDTRCNPMHTRKMVARMQAATSSDLPILLDYQPEWGHTATQPLTRRINALTDRLAFVCHEIGVKVSREKF